MDIEQNLEGLLAGLSIPEPLDDLINDASLVYESFLRGEIRKDNNFWSLYLACLKARVKCRTLMISNSLERKFSEYLAYLVMKQNPSSKLETACAIKLLHEEASKSIFSAYGKAYSGRMAIKSVDVEEPSPKEFLRQLGYLLFVDSKAKSAVAILNKMISDKKLWEELAAVHDRGKGAPLLLSKQQDMLIYSLRLNYSLEMNDSMFYPPLPNAQLFEPMNKGLPQEVVDRYVEVEDVVKKIYQSLGGLKHDTLFDVRKHRIIDYIRRMESYLTHPETFTHIQVESESRDFIENLFDDERYHCCAFGPRGSMATAVLGYLADENIGLLKLIPYNQDKRLDPIAVAIIVNTKDGQGNNVWDVDSVEGGRYVKRIDKRKCNWYQVMYDAIIEAAKDSPFEPTSIVINTQFDKIPGHSIEPKNFRDYALKRNGMKRKDCKTYILNKPQNEELNKAIGANRLLEAWYNGKEGSEWNTGEGNVTGIEIKLAA